MLAILWDLDLEDFIEKDAECPKVKNPADPMDEEIKEQKQWKTRDVKARTRIELAIRDAEMIHIIGATSAKQMWGQLTMVKESRG